MSKKWTDLLEDYAKDIKKDDREKWFALFGFAHGLYMTGDITLDEYVQLMERVPVDNDDLKAALP